MWQEKNLKGNKSMQALVLQNISNYWINSLRLKSSCLKNNAKKISIRSKYHTDIWLKYHTRFKSKIAPTPQCKLAGALLSSSAAFYPRGHLNISDGTFWGKAELQNNEINRFSNISNTCSSQVTKTRKAESISLDFIHRPTFSLSNSDFMQISMPLVNRAPS